MRFGSKSLINRFILKVNQRNRFFSLKYTLFEKMSEKIEFKIQAKDRKFVGFTKGLSLSTLSPKLIIYLENRRRVGMEVTLYFHSERRHTVRANR